MASGLLYVRDLVGDEVVEIHYVMLDQLVAFWSFLPEGWTQALSVAMALCGGGVPLNARPKLRSLYVSAANIPREIPAGTLLSRYSMLSGQIDYWEAPHHYVFREGSAYPFVLPQLRADWSLSLSAFALTGWTLTYTTPYADFPSIVPSESDPNYSDPFLVRNSRVLRLPTAWSSHEFEMYHRHSYVSGGYYYTDWARCPMCFLWAYPPASLPSDMRYMNSQEHIEIEDSFVNPVLVDEVDDAPVGISRLPTPDAPYCRRELLNYGNTVIDWCEGLSSELPVVVYQPSSVRRTRQIPVSQLPVVLDRLMSRFLSMTLGGRLLGIADKILSLNGMLCRVQQ